MKVLISKIYGDQREKVSGEIIEVKEDTPKNKETGHGRRTYARTRKKKKPK